MVMIENDDRTPLPRVLLDRPARAVAPEPVGGIPVRGMLRAGEPVPRTTEVAAYDGAKDPAAHARRGRAGRDAVVPGPRGRASVHPTRDMSRRPA